MNAKRGILIFWLISIWSIFSIPHNINCQTSAHEYFPPPESEGGWRKNTNPDFILSLGIDPVKLEEFGQYNLSVENSTWMPYAQYKGIIVIKDGWIVGELYNIPEARTFKTYISSNGKSFAMIGFGIMADDSRKGVIDEKITVASRGISSLRSVEAIHHIRAHISTYFRIMSRTNCIWRRGGKRP